jgi:NADH-quinone oxidoreductase subunit L
LRRKLPITFAAMLIASLTLAGVPGLSAFFSKDLILEAGFDSGHSLVALTGLATSLLTAFYAWRMMSLAFYGEARTHQLAVHEAPVSMRVPMMILAGCCVFVGWLFVPIHWAAWSVMLTSTLAAAAGIWAAWQLYVVRPDVRQIVDTRFAPLANLLRNRWYIDAAYEDHLVEGFVFGAATMAASIDMTIVDGSVNGAAGLSRRLARLSNWFDSSIVDGAVRLISMATHSLSWPFRALQTGFVQTYVFIFIAGVLAIAGFYLSR